MEYHGGNNMCSTNNTFCISFLPSASPIITDDLHARDANIAWTLDGQMESAVSILYLLIMEHSPWLSARVEIRSFTSVSKERATNQLFQACWSNNSLIYVDFYQEKSL